MGRKPVLFAAKNLGRGGKNLIYSKSRSVALGNAMLNYLPLIASARRLTIISKLKEFVGIVASLKWLPPLLLIGHIAIVNVWLKITKIGTRQKIIGIGKAVSQRSNAVIAYMTATRNGEGQCSNVTAMFARYVKLTKAVYWLLTTFKSDKITPNYCLIWIMG